MQEKAQKIFAQFAQLATAGAPKVDLDRLPPRQIEAAGICLDYTRARIDAQIIELGERLLAAADISGRIEQMDAGEPVNFTEKRPAWHTRLRDPHPGSEVAQARSKACAFANRVRSGEIRGAAGAYTDIVHIGIGGSYLGPKLLCEAAGSGGGPQPHFIGNLDPAASADVLARLEPGTTLVVAASKSGQTAETLANSATARAWLAAKLGEPAAGRQFVAVSANRQAGEIFACPSEQVFRLWDWTTGRYSLWSSISITAMIACGYEFFDRLLAGAHRMDLHAKQAQGIANMPALLALLRCWHSLALGAQSHCVVAYAHRLRSLAAYLQQLAMESNGKAADWSGKPLDRPAGEIWWGGEGTNDQHSYFQMLLQGGVPIPADFVCFRQPAAGEDEKAHRHLLANCLGMARALTIGRSRQQAVAQLQETGSEAAAAEALSQHLVVAGDQPVNLIIAERLDAETLGALIALYEHQIAIAGWLHGINSFDQFGVQFRTENFAKVLTAIESNDSCGLDPSTAALVARATGKTG